MANPLDTDALIEAARRATGFDDFGAQSYREGLDILVSDINNDTQRPQEFVDRNQGMLVKALIDRLNVTAALKRRPELLERPIERPVFVFGLPRTGTTLLNNLLAADPARRSPLKWELDDPVPPPTTATLYTDPRALAALEEEAAALGIDLSKTAAIGDGANDLAMIEAAGLGVAYRAKPIVAERARARIDHTDLTALLFFQGYEADEFARGEP